MNNKYSVSIILFLTVFTSLFFTNVPILIQSDSKLSDLPQVELLDLLVDGTNNVTISINHSRFDYVLRIIFTYHFITNSLDWDNWGDDATLNNGWLVSYNTSSLVNGNPIKNNFNLAQFTYDWTILQDDKNPIGNVITFRYSFWKFSEHGFKINSTHKIDFTIQDNLTALLVSEGGSWLSFTAAVEGCTDGCFPDTELVSVVNTVPVFDVNDTTTTTIPTTIILAPNGFRPSFKDFEGQYYFGTNTIIELQFLIVGHTYSIEVGTNQPVSERQWINRTADSSVWEVSFKQDSEPFDSNNNKINFLQISLFEGDNLLDFLVLPIVFENEQFEPFNLATYIFNGAIAIFLVIALVFIIFRRKK